MSKITRTYLSGCPWCNATGVKYPMQYEGNTFTSVCPVCNGGKTIIVTEVIEDNEPQTER
jgi:hypothetical protein